MAFRYHDLMVNLAGEGGERDKDRAGTACCPNSPCTKDSVRECTPKSHPHPGKDDDKKRREERKLADLSRLQSQLRQALDAAQA